MRPGGPRRESPRPELHRVLLLTRQACYCVYYKGLLKEGGGLAPHVRWTPHAFQTWPARWSGSPSLTDSGGIAPHSLAGAHALAKRTGTLVRFTILMSLEGFAPPTPCTSRRCSTPELKARVMDLVGIAPSERRIETDTASEPTSAR